MESISVSVVKCPECGFSAAERMTPFRRVLIYRCEGCGTILNPKPGDDCVFCSYGTVPCPERQAENSTVLKAVEPVRRHRPRICNG